MPESPPPRFTVSRLGTVLFLHTPVGDYQLTKREVDHLIGRLCDESTRAGGIEPRSGEPCDPLVP